MLKPSLLHRLLNVTPGRYPWLCNASACGEGWVGLIDVVVIGALLGCLALSYFGFVSAWISIPIWFAFLGCLFGPFTDRERFARARRRRGECIWCGVKCAPEEATCGGCGRVKQ
jgi:hypothetical protein